MPDPFLGEIRMFAGNFAPRDWALCDGQLLSIAQNTALFSILGTTYGGDGRTTFGVPDLRGRSPIHQGDGPGLSSVRLGEEGGAEEQTLTENQLPAHNHPLNGSTGASDQSTPTDGVPAVPTDTPATTAQVYSTAMPDTLFAADTVGDTGSGDPVSVRSPYLAINYIIALQGQFPSRS